ncbi:glutamate receptor 4-like [Mytilus californianus]|uniref:glutamate receptor 4-like n=1 Tax=Mytilus californianus TaxID=6549 RepID=UPI002245FC04|nr:glutamate receptor 4-like [Mytilus californianus]
MTPVTFFYVFVLMLPECFGKCYFGKNQTPVKYKFAVGILSPSTGLIPLQEFVEKNIQSNDTEVIDCYSSISIVNINVRDNLTIQENGWTNIKDGLYKTLKIQANDKAETGVSVVIGPYYTNLAMILEQENIPYVITQDKGFDYVDETRIEDHVSWSNLLEVTPPAEQLNQAIVDLFLAWQNKTAVVVLPDDPKINDVCQDLIRRMIANQISPISYSLQMNSEEDIRNQTVEVLRNAQLLRQEIILICSPRDDQHKLIQNVLKEAKSFGNIMENERNIFIFHDSSMYLEPFDEGPMYRQGLFEAKCQLLAYRYTEIRPGSKYLTSSYEATAIDTAHLIQKSQKLYLKKMSGIDEHVDIFNRTKMIEALRESTLPNGKTGSVKFDSDGKRINYTFHLYNHGGTSLFKKIGEWRPKGNTTRDRLVLIPVNDTQEKDTRGIFPDIVKVVFVMEEPFIMNKRGNVGYEGFTIDLLEELSKLLSFKYVLYPSPNNAYGSEIDGQWNGMIEQVRTGNATLGMGAISITSEREEVVDFSLGVLSTGVNMLISKPKEHSSIFQFMRPFTLELWMGILGATVIVCIVYLMLDTGNPDRKFTLKEVLWFSVGTLLMRGTDFSPRPSSQRILTAGFTFFVLITVSTYTANMAAFLTKVNLDQPVETLIELAERTNIQVGTINNSATMRFLESSEDSTYKTIWKRVLESNGLVTNSSQGRQRSGEGNFAFIYDYLINSYFEKNYCKTKMSGQPIRLQEHGILMKAGNPAKTSINIAILQLKEKGFITRLRKRWWEDKRQCSDAAMSKSVLQVEFGVKHMSGVLIVLLFGLAFSVAFFLFKKFYVLSKQQKSSKKESKGKENEDKDGETKSMLGDEDTKIFGNEETKTVFENEETKPVFGGEVPIDLERYTNVYDKD